MRRVEIAIRLLIPRTKNEILIPETFVQDVRDHGVVNPLYVRQEGDHYKILDGELRYRVAKMLAHKSIFCYVMTDKDISEATIPPSRSPIQPAEYAQQLRMLMEHYHLSELELAEKIGKTEAWVKEKLRAK